MTTLPPELAAFASLLDAHLCRTIPTLPVGTGRCRQPPHVQDAFNYCLCLLMVQAGKMRLEKKVPGETGRVCVFETLACERVLSHAGH